MGKPIISVFGTSRADEGDPVYDLAYGVGRALARAGITIANGGYDGTMLAAAKGAAEAAGEVIGVTCSVFKGRANEYVSREIATWSPKERLDTLVNLGRGYIVLPGGTGTLLELAMVWELKNKGFLGEEKPIILLGEFWNPLVQVIASDDSAAVLSIRRAYNPEQAVKIIIDS